MPCVAALVSMMNAITSAGRASRNARISASPFGAQLVADVAFGATQVEIGRFGFGRLVEMDVQHQRADAVGELGRDARALIADQDRVRVRLEARRHRIVAWWRTQPGRSGARTVARSHCTPAGRVAPRRARHRWASRVHGDRRPRTRIPSARVPPAPGTRRRRPRSRGARSRRRATRSPPRDAALVTRPSSSRSASKRDVGNAATRTDAQHERDEHGSGDRVAARHPGC